VPLGSVVAYAMLWAASAAVCDGGVPVPTPCCRQCV